MQFIKAKSFTLAHSFLSIAEKGILAAIPQRVFRTNTPIFIIGPPRSGTTLLYQLIIFAYGFSYLTNLAARFYKAPALVLWIMDQWFRRETRVSFHSHYGRTEGIWGPHEAGNFWYRWFPRGDHIYVSEGVTSAKSLKEIRKEVMAIGRVTHRPVIFKNTYNTMRIAPIVEALPDAVFLVMVRDPLDIAQSILEARMKLDNDKQTWWALPPKEIDLIRLHPYWQQIPEQVYYIYRQIETDRSRFGSDRFFNVDYRRICLDLENSLDQLESFFLQKGIPFSRRKQIPDRFPYSTGRRVSLDDFNRLKEETRRLWKQN